MSKFEFESHEMTPEDQYIKEIVTFKFTYENDSFYVPYFRKSTKDGGSFWSVASVGVTQHGNKKYTDAFVLDSRMREKQIKEYLDLRKWENKSVHAAPQPSQTAAIHYPHGMAQPKSEAVAAEAELPF